MINLIIVVLLAVLTAGVGIRAAQLWRRSSVLYASPPWETNGGIEPVAATGTYPVS
jgi:hypothetical protein